MSMTPGLPDLLEKIDKLVRMHPKQERFRRNVTVIHPPPTPEVVRQAKEWLSIFYHEIHAKQGNWFPPDIEPEYFEDETTIGLSWKRGMRGLGIYFQSETAVDRALVGQAYDYTKPTDTLWYTAFNPQLPEDRAQWWKWLMDEKGEEGEEKEK